MKFAKFTVRAVLLFAATSPAIFAQGWQWGHPRAPRSGACFYQNANFGGNYFCMMDGERWPSLPRGFNDSISSIRVFGGARLRVFYDDNFGGVSLLVDHNLNNLARVRRADSRNSWNDRISAIAVFRDRDEWAPGYAR